MEPVVSVLLTALREWGIQIGELGFLSMLLNNSLEYNKNQAICKLWGQYMPQPLSPDDVSMIVIDRVLSHGKSSIPKA